MTVTTIDTLSTTRDFEAAGLARKRGSENASWLGIPCPSFMNSRSLGSHACPNASMSTQVYPPVSIDRRPISNISCRSWRVALLRPWALNSLKKLTKILHRDSPSVDRGAELDGFTPSWVSAKSKSDCPGDNP